MGTKNAFNTVNYVPALWNSRALWQALDDTKNWNPWIGAVESEFKSEIQDESSILNLTIWVTATAYNITDKGSP